MRRTLSLYDIEKTEDDFKFEIIEIGHAVYNGWTPIRTLTAKVDGVLCNVRTSINIELAEDFKLAFNIDVSSSIDHLLKREAIDWYINSNQYIRKLKLEKIRREYGV